MFKNILASSLVLSASALTSSAASLDSDLVRSFWGIAYTATGVILPECGATQAQVTEDMGLVAQLTPRIRTYASDCNQTELVLQGIQDTNADLSVWIGIYIDGNDTVYERQMNHVVEAIAKFGTDHIAGITVGNEYLLDSYGSNGSPTDAAGVAARTKLLSYISQTNETIQALGLSKHIPLGTSDAGSAITLELCEGADYIMANVHPWFGSVAIDDAATWTYDFFQEYDVDVCAPAANNPTMYIAETGWPTASNDTANAVNGGGAAASVANLQTFLDDFICQANANGTDYFFFEYKDEHWKLVEYGGVEGYWGLFDEDGNLKSGLTMPTCKVTSPTGGTVDQLTLGSSSSSNSSSSTSSSGAKQKSNASDDSAAAPRLTSTTGSAGLIISVGALFLGGWLI